MLIQITLFERVPLLILFLAGRCWMAMYKIRYIQKNIYTRYGPNNSDKKSKINGVLL